MQEKSQLTIQEKRKVIVHSFTFETAKNCFACWMSPCFLQVNAAILYSFRLVVKSSKVLLFSAAES